MKLHDMSPTQRSRRITGGGLDLRIGPLVVRLQSRIRQVVRGLELLYADYPVEPEDGLADIHVRIERPRNHRRFIAPRVCFVLDGMRRYSPVPPRMALALLEWGLNLCVINRSHRYLNVHSAIVERGGYAAILPAMPGSGKSTLCAALIHRGWRLLSDEMTLVQPEDLRLQPIPRPVNLKNQSIGLLQRYAPQARFGPLIRDTHKGHVAHMRPPTDSVMRVNETAAPGWIIFPQYQPDAPPTLTTMPRSRTLIRLADNAFNYGTLNDAAFRVVADLVDRCHCFQFTYSRLDDAVEVFNNLTPPETPPQARPFHGPGSGPGSP